MIRYAISFADTRSCDRMTTAKARIFLAGTAKGAAMKSLPLIAALMIAAPAVALEPIRTEKHINHVLLQGFIGDAIADNCPTIEPRKLRALGVTSPKRVAQFPDIPAIAESLPGYSSQAWFGLFGPARMAPDLVKRVSDAARAALRLDSVRKRMEGDAGEAVGSSPEEFAAFVKADVARWAQLVKYSSATPD